MDGSLYKIKKGLDLKLEGEADKTLKAMPVSGTYAVCPDDFYGITPRLLVKEGQQVMAGEPLFCDKQTGTINVVAPVSGTIAAVVRGERRKLLHVDIAAEATQQYKEYKKTSPQDNADTTVAALADAGLFAFIHQRPYDVVATTTDRPKAIFVSAFSKMPLAADFSFVVKGKEDEFKAGIALLARIANVYLGICPEQGGDAFVNGVEATVNTFDGPNPAGNVGVHINHVAPINKGEIVWTVDAQSVILIGHFALTGLVDLTRRIAVAGACVAQPQYVETKIGTPLAALIPVATPHVRLINGNPLVGRRAAADGFLAANVSEVCAIPEGDDVNEVFGWIAPRLSDFSTSRSYFSWLQPRRKAYNLDCRIKGGERHMIMSGEYDRVFPMDIFPGYLVKAIIAGDIDRQEALGIYEVAPEDFAVAEFVDSSKLELQRIVREGLDLLRKENA